MRLRREHGFAIPLTIYVVTIVTLMLAVVYAGASADRRSADATGDHVEALSIAQAGLETYLGTVNVDACDWPIRPTDGDSVRINVNGGYADVVARVVRRPADSLAPWTYVVRSTGRVITPTQGQDPQAVRTVAQFARWNPGALGLLGTFTAANGISNPGNRVTGELRGTDQATTCPQANINPVRTYSAGAPSLDYGDADDPWVLDGATPYILAYDDQTTVANATKIDWNATINGGITPDYTTLRIGDTSYPVMLINGNLTVDMTSDTQVWGTLIVTGSLEIKGPYQFQFYGVLLVGGRIQFNAADQRFDGAVISGLNHQLGQNMQKNGFAVVQLHVDIAYDSQHIRRALNRLSGFAPVQNAVVDNWASY